MYKKYSKINNLAYIKNKINIDKYINDRIGCRERALKLRKKGVKRNKKKRAKRNKKKSNKINKNSKINDLAYIKRTVKLTKYHLSDRNYTEFLEINDKVRSDLSIQYEVSSLDLIQKLNKGTNKKRFYSKHFRCIKCFKLRNKSQISINKTNICVMCRNFFRNKYVKMMRDKNPILKLISHIRCRTRLICKKRKWKKNMKFRDYIGCSVKTFKKHIQSQFTSKMNWNNHGTYWELDHIKPIGLAKTRKKVFKLNHYSNLQPLTIKQHKKKTKEDMKRK